MYYPFITSSFIFINNKHNYGQGCALIIFTATLHVELTVGFPLL